MSEVVIPNLQVKKIEESVLKNIRLDGRKIDEYRKLIVEDGISPAAASAILVRLGNTEVLAGVHLAPATPYSDAPDEGTFMTSAELHPMASQKFDLGKPGIDAVELARIVDRGIRESGFIDFKGLCIEAGEKVWQVFVDIIAINDDGNLLDVAGIAALIALGKARVPVYNKETGMTEHEFSDQKLPLNKELMSLNMTFHKVGKAVVADVSREEESISKFRLSIAIADNEGRPRITAMQKGRPGTISNEDMENILKLAVDKWMELFPKVKELVFD